MEPDHTLQDGFLDPAMYSRFTELEDGFSRLYLSLTNKAGRY